jgi:glycosyltransferase involved in cell wall biosynthesis
MVPEPAAPQYAWTIVVPIYNRPELLVTLHERLQELWPKWQACGAGEVLVVDDGSTDSTLVVARRLAEQSTIPVRITSQPNKGVSGARNRGFWEARGEVGIVLDSDCLPSEEWLPAMYRAVMSKPKTLAFAEIYSERRVQYPLEASPGGVPFVGASFAARVEDYVAIGGNCELFDGAARDDNDLSLTAREMGFHVTIVSGARVWHPIRSQSVSTIYRAGLHHRYDNLLAKRHGDRALFCLGDWLLGGSFAGHYPLSLIVYAFVVLVLYDLVNGIFSGNGPHLASIAQIFIVLVVLWCAAQITFMRLLAIPAKKWSDFFVANAAHGFGAMMGRIRGTFVYAFPLL